MFKKPFVQTKIQSLKTFEKHLESVKFGEKVI